MAPTPSSLRGAADAIRRTARRIELDFEPLVHKGGRETWEGPAATTFRRDARGVERRGVVVGEGLRRLAQRLDNRADDLQASIAAEKLQAEEHAAEARRRQASRWNEVESFGSRARPWPASGEFGPLTGGGWDYFLEGRAATDG